MQLLLLLLLLSAQNGGFKEIKPLLESVGGEDIKNVIGEAERVAEVIELAKVFMPQPQAVEKFQTAVNENDAESEANCPFSEVSSFADSEIISALSEYIDG